MNTKDIRSAIAYNEWANGRVLQAVGGIAPERLNATVVSSFPSLMATLAHIIAVEWLWLKRRFIAFFQLVSALVRYFI